MESPTLRKLTSAEAQLGIVLEKVLELQRRIRIPREGQLTDNDPLLSEIANNLKQLRATIAADGERSHSHLIDGEYYWGVRCTNCEYFMPLAHERRSGITLTMSGEIDSRCPSCDHSEIHRPEALKRERWIQRHQSSNGPQKPESVRQGSGG